MFVMSLLYIVMMFAAPAINPGATFVSMDLSMKSLIPNFNVAYFTSLSILVFAVGGCEKISPYVNKVENPSKGFPKGMISLAIMVVVCAILGTFAMGMMFDPAVINESTESFNSYAANGSYWAFQKLGEYWHVGDFFLIIYAICNLISQFAILVLSIDAPLRMLLDNDDTRQFIPSKLQKKNKYGVYSNGILLVAILSGAIILIQSVVPGAAAVLQQLTKLNSVCMPLRYLWVFVAFIAVVRLAQKYKPEYVFIRNKPLAMTVGIWCFAFTAFACLTGIFPKMEAFTAEWTFQLALNVATPFVLVGLGLIFPLLARKANSK